MWTANRLVSSPDDMGGPARLLFFGGGRWARIVLEVLLAQTGGATRIVWVTQHNADSAREWITRRGCESIDVVSECPVSISEFSGAIVATSVDRHYSLARQLLEHGVPVLCEKPIAMTKEQLDELRRLSERGDCPIGIHLEFAYLRAFDDFLELVRGIKIERIDVDWLDPTVEIRDGVEKRAEFRCDIISDQVPHIWSLVSRVSLNQSGLEIHSVDYSPVKTLLVGSIGNIGVQFQLSRRHSTRRRSVILNHGEATFDFTVEPPNAFCHNQVLNLPVSQFRPLQLSLASFLAQITTDSPKREISGGSDRLETEDSSEKLNPSWPLSLNNQYGFLLECLKGSELLKKSQDQYAACWLSNDCQENLDNVELPDYQIAYLIDRWLPVAVQAGHWLVPKTPDEERVFAGIALIKRGDWSMSD
ncbi:Gfo/Idh/MocA family protein [Pirellulaceae bacterium SH449]